MTDDELIRLPNLDAKYAAFRAAVEWGISKGLVKRPQIQKTPELKKAKLASSKYYRENV